MEHNQFPVKLFVGGALIASLCVSACTSNDTNTATTDENVVDTVTTTGDTALTMPDTSMLPRDTAAMPTSDVTQGSSSTTTGVAKPNAAKKGLKGKIAIAPLPKASAKADAAPDASGVYKNVDRIPAFPGGYAALQQYFNTNIRYPMDAQDQGVEGTVRVAFTVDEQGRLMNPVIEGDSQGYGLDEEALRVVSKMPAWTAGMVGGKPVRTRFVLPVQFTLQ